MKLLLDASAVLAYLHAEPGAEHVEAALDSPVACWMTAANHAEVISKCLDRGVTAATVGGMLDDLGYQIASIEATDGDCAGRLRSTTRALGLSLGDRLCLAVAQRLGYPILTADRPWLGLAAPLALDIRCIRPDSH